MGGGGETNLMRVGDGDERRGSEGWGRASLRGAAKRRGGRLGRKRMKLGTD